MISRRGRSSSITISLISWSNSSTMICLANNMFSSAVTVNPPKEDSQEDSLVSLLQEVIDAVQLHHFQPLDKSHHELY